jgi:hypothetical protein
VNGFPACLVYDPPGHLAEVQTGDDFRRAERGWRKLREATDLYESPAGERFEFTSHKAITGDGRPSLYEGWMTPLPAETIVGR